MGLTSIIQSLDTSRLIKLLLAALLILPLAFPPAARAAGTLAQPGTEVAPGSLDARTDQALHSAALNFSQIAAGDAYTCAVTAAGGVKCWGDIWSGQSSIPVDVSSLSSGVTGLAAGLWHTCAVVGGAAMCWGSNFSGQLGDNTLTPHTIPAVVSGLGSGVTAIAAGSSHTCAVVSGGVQCWGDNQAKQLGAGLNDWQVTTPVDVVGLSSGVIALAAGDYHTCALMDAAHNRVVKCWGWNTSGQLGDGTKINQPTPVTVSSLTGVMALAAGDFHTCALTSSGGVKCWGDNSIGQLGDGTFTGRAAPVNVNGLTGGVSAISSGRTHTCAVAGGAVRCWGENAYGQLGDGSITTRNTPVTTSGLAGAAIAVAAGGRHSCAILTGGTAMCWGDNNYGQLGDGTIVKRGIPVDVNGLAGVSALAAGYQHACAAPDLAHGGGVKCWGDNADGQLGDGTSTPRGAPVSVSGLSGTYSALAAGRWHTCAVSSGGGVKCWGRNATGQLGNDSNTSSLTAVTVSDLSGGIQTLAAGWYHTCALTTGGGVKCWGDNGYGELGDGSNTQRRKPVDVSGLSSGVIALAAGDTHTCAVMDAGHGGGVKCWGWNSYGQLGDGTNTTSTTPVVVGGLSAGVKTVAAGGFHTCVVTSTDGVSCWGDGNKTPAGVPGLSGIIGLGAGSSHSCALTTPGGVKCAGINGSGQLGDGTTTPRPAPVDVNGLASGVRALAGGAFHSCALMSDGGVKCWGSDGLGQLGIGTLTRRLTPVEVVESILPLLTINHSYGQPGSTFTLTGWNFPASSNMTVSINGHVLPSTVPVKAMGSFIFFLTTTNADEGGYTLNTTSSSSAAPENGAEGVAASLNPSGTVSFILFNGATLHLPSGGGQTLDLPAGIAVEMSRIFLPLLMK